MGKDTLAKSAVKENLGQLLHFSRRLYFLQALVLVMIMLTASTSWGQIGQLRDIAITPKNDSTGIGATYIISFKVQKKLERDDKILLTFPPAFDISEIFVASNLKNLDGGFRVFREIGSGLVTIDRDGFGLDLAAGDTGTFKIAIVGNPKIPGTYSLDILTQDFSGNSLDHGIGSVKINPGPLDHFALSTIANQVVDANFSFRVTAKDLYNNNTRAYKGNITLSDNTGTLSPGSVTLADTSVTVSSAKITKPAGGIKITASTTLGGKTKIGNSNSFNINQLKILSIDAASATVSRGQTFIPVNMIVQNMGPDTVRLDSAKLTFSPAGYTNTRLAPNIKIPGQGAIRNFIFSISVNTTAPMGLATIDGQIFGTVIPGNLKLSDLNADLPLDSWTVQTQPNLSYTPNSLTPKQVYTGAFFQFQIGVKNNGNATLELNPATTIFQFSDLGQTFTATLDAAGGTTVAGNEQKVLIFQSTKIASTIRNGNYTPQVILHGTQNGAAFNQLITLPNNTLAVSDPPTFQILSIRSSQDTVVQGMRKPWSIFLRVKNNTNSDITFDHAELQFYKPGTNTPDAFYRLTLPVSFALNHSKIISNGIDSVICRIESTGKLTGVIAIFAKVFVKELPLSPAESNGTQKSILVQTPAKLSVTLQTSQPKVTESQTQPWRITMQVKNEGESDAQAIFATEPISDNITRTSLTGDYIVTPAETDVIIAGNKSTDIYFDVTQTGSILPNSTFNGQVFAQEVNSDSIHFAATSAPIQVQPRERVEIATVEVDSIFNRNPGAIDTVNVGQSFKVKVSVRSTVTNAEQVDSVRVRLTSSNQNDFISNNLRTLSGLNGFLTFPVSAGAPAANTSNFSAQVVEAYSANTRAWTVQANPGSRSVFVHKQAPAQLSVNTPTTSVTSVRFGSTQPAWTIDCLVANSAVAGNGSAIVVDSSKVTVTINNVPQLDYVIQNRQKPTTLNAGQQGLLKYEVVQTGYTGGEATLKVMVFGHDKNTNLLLSSSNSKKITVATSALVRILQTDFAANVNRVAGSEIGLVNTGQKFKIEVTVENTGLEVIDTAYVSLQSSGASTISPPLAMATTIGTNGDTAKAIFYATAASLANANGERFIARLGRLVAKGGAAAQGANSDTTALARIELPARLQLNLVTADGVTSFGFNQRFKIRARVKNLGEAQIDHSGLLTLSLPLNKSYSLVSGESAQKSFAEGDSVEWNVLTPNNESLSDAFTVKLTAPFDKNSGQPAQVANQTAQISISTRANALHLDQKSIVAPTGAADRILSTDQIFTIRVQVDASPNLTNKTVTLALPSGSGFRFVGGEVAMKNTPADTARWQVQAPSLENLKSVRLLFNLSAFSAQTPVSNLDSLVILGTEKQAILQIEPGLEGTGSQSNVVAVKQNFNIVATIRNTGRATVVDTAIVTLNAPAALTVRSKLSQKIAFPTGTTVQKIIWQATAPADPQQNAITFTITQKPFDANTGLEVLTSNDPATFAITTETKGTVAADPPRITAPFGAQNDLILSTGQEFIISDTLRWANAANLTATLNLPAGFTIFNRVQNIPNPKEKDKTEVSWVVRAPVEPTPNVEAGVLLQANDSHDVSVPLTSISNSLQFNVVRRAEVSLSAEITDPPSATDGVLSVNQPFTVVATIANLGTAKVSSTARVFLRLPQGYQFINPQQDTLAVGFPNGTCRWLVRARATITNGSDLMTLQLTQPPLDENTGVLAAINDGEATLAVRTEGRKLIVAAAGDQGGGPASQGQQDLLLMRLLLTNPGEAGASNLRLQTLSFELRKRDGTSPIEPGAVFQNVRIFNEGRRVGKAENIPTGSSVLPITLNENGGVNIAPGIPDTVSIFADLTTNATGTFRLLFDNGNDFDAIDEEGGVSVAIESAEGKQGDKFRLESNLTALHGATDDNSFFNYPNPFLPGKNVSHNEGTRFSVPSGVSGELKIVTLLGELVWETKIDARSTSIFWDGNNGAGQRVLNGVYVAILKTTAGKMLTTKVAVLKR